MAFYTYKNCRVKLNGENLFVTDAQIQERTTNTPQYRVLERHAHNHSADSHIGGQLRLQYYLTGSDPLKDFISNETGVISGNFGGLSFESGFLESYSFAATPANPVQIQSTILFFDDLKGSFSPVYEAADSQSFLNFSDARITTISGVGDLDNVLQVQYGYNSEIEPVMLAGQKTPHRIHFGKKNAQMSIDIDNLSGDLNITGNGASLDISLRKSDTSDFLDSYGIRGIMTAKQIQVSANEPLRSNLTIRQDYVSAAPVIDYFEPSSFYELDEVTIACENAHEVSMVCFGDTCVHGSKIKHLNPTGIRVRCPLNASVSDPYITVRGMGGDDEADTPYNLQFYPMTIPSMQPAKEEDGQKITDVYGSSQIYFGGSNKYERLTYTGQAGQTVIIRGKNLTRVDGVYFGNGHSADFRVIREWYTDPTLMFAMGMLPPNEDGLNHELGLIQAEIPVMADRGPVYVTSAEKGQTAKCPFTFTPAPSITGISAQQGSPGDVITIRGTSFTDVTGVYMGWGESHQTAVAFSIDSSSGISATIPVGDYHGTIRVYGKDQYEHSERGTEGQTPKYRIFADSAEEHSMKTDPVITGFMQSPWSTSTWEPLGHPWETLKTACQNVLAGGTQTIDITYSFCEDNVGIRTAVYNPVSYGKSLLNHNHYALTNIDNANFPSILEFTGDVGAAFDEWKSLFENSFPGLTLNFINKGIEQNVEGGPGQGPGGSDGGGGGYASPGLVGLDINEQMQPSPGGSYDLTSSAISTANIGDIRIVGTNLDAGQGGVLAMAFSPYQTLGSLGHIGGDVFFDMWEQWTSDEKLAGAKAAGYPAAMSVKYVMTHELGHSLGLGHDLSTESLLHASMQGDGTLSGFCPDGLSGHSPVVDAIKVIYGEGYYDAPVEVTGGIAGTPILIKGYNFKSGLMGGCVEDYDGVYRGYAGKLWEEEKHDTFRTKWGEGAATTGCFLYENYVTVDETTLSGMIPLDGQAGMVQLFKRGRRAGREGNVSWQGQTIVVDPSVGYWPDMTEPVGTVWPSGKEFNVIPPLGVITIISPGTNLIG